MARLDGAHTLAGCSYSGLGTLLSNSATSISQAVTIACEVLDFDGLAKAVHVNADLTINSALLDSGMPMRFGEGKLDGTFRSC